ncbi:ARM repeat-containing protein [Stereum hirsutum FP-91666 SS1]|uniref:ARM repeat-containing protein n=1 Tax=Stereum hirsutum (strain FP-91666) TaxID=721885 RepID=UPI0004410225|nr:ARM repeat-containing protein [Stereum hirsutum FP-91666 SS1]EIM91308.1 ARM repeat-containing protein [Stereum hirsutum FP-91666 SS1]
MNNFGTIYDQIIDWANKSESERDGFTLIQVLRIVYGRALDASSPTIYARLCRKMMENISDKVQIDGLRGRDGKPIAGGKLFRRYLLNRVQADFECCWVLKGAGAAASRFQQSEDTGTAENDAMGGVEDPFSANYNSPETVEKRVLGLVRLMGELFKLQMITERIMHECLRQLIKDGGEPGLESICGLMRTVGQILDSKPMRPCMDVYFDNMKQLTLDPRIEPRVVRMLKDVIELRKRGWKPDPLLD